VGLSGGVKKIWLSWKKYSLVCSQILFKNLIISIDNRTRILVKNLDFCAVNAYLSQSPAILRHEQIAQRTVLGQVLGK
jgi:hypothetical protein